MTFLESQNAEAFSPRQAPTSALQTVEDAFSSTPLPSPLGRRLAAAEALRGSTPTTLGAAAAARLDARISAFFLSLERVEESEFFKG